VKLFLTVAAGAIGAIVTAPSLAYAQSRDQRWQATLNSEVRYFSFSSSNASPSSSTASGGSGSQTYVPVAGQLVGRVTDDLKAEFLLRSAYVYSKQTTSGASGVYEGFTDTTFSTTATWYGLNGVQPFVSLALNIPTGTSNASGGKQNAKSDSDIVRLPAFGEGWNVGPTIGATIPITAQLMSSLALGYTNRGPFRREADTAGAINRLDPGDVATLTGTLSYRGDRLSLKGSAAYAWETVTELDGAAFYKSGDRIVLTGAAGYAWTENWSSRVQATFSHFNKNKVRLPGASDITVEAFNSNSNVINVVFDTTYARGAFSIGPTAGYVYRDRNGWNPETFQFLPAKTSWSAGVAGGYAVTQTARVAGSVARIWVNEGGSPDKIADGVLMPSSAIPAAVTNAWQATLSGTVRF
jgi:hypothetical protein